MALVASERETTMTVSDDERMWHISSYRRADITRLKKNPDFVIEGEGTFEGTPYIFGKLPLGGIAIRAKSAGTGTIKRASAKKREMPNVARCGTIKENGEPCGSIASKETGSCSRHPAKK